MENFDFLYSKAKESLDRANYPYAITLFARALNLNADSHQCRKLLHLCYQKNFDLKSRNLPNKIIMLAAYAYRRLLAVCAKFSNDKRAYIAALEKTLKHNPRCAWSLAQMGTALREIDMPSSAKAVFEELYGIAPESVIALNNLAGILFSEGDLKGAFSCAKKALALNPQNGITEKIIKDIQAQKTIDRSFDDSDDSGLKIDL